MPFPNYYNYNIFWDLNTGLKCLLLTGNCIQLNAHVICYIGIPSQCLTHETLLISNKEMIRLAPETSELRLLSSGWKAAAASQTMKCGLGEFAEFLHCKERCIVVELWHFRTRKKYFISWKSHCVLSQQPLLFLLPQFSPCGEAAEFVCDDKPDHEGELWCFLREVSVSSDVDRIAVGLIVSLRPWYVVTEYTTEIRCGWFYTLLLNHLFIQLDHCVAACCDECTVLISLSCSPA